MMTWVKALKSVLENKWSKGMRTDVIDSFPSSTESLSQRSSKSINRNPENIVRLDIYLKTVVTS